MAYSAPTTPGTRPKMRIATSSPEYDLAFVVDRDVGREGRVDGFEVPRFEGE